MSWEDTENAMQKAVAQASGYPADRVFWSYQNVDEPSLDHITIVFGGEIVIGIDRIANSQDLSRPRGQEMKQEISGVREVPFEISCFTATTSGNIDARRILELTRTRLRLSDVRVPLRKAGITPFDSGPVRYAPDIPNAGFRGRAICTVRCYVPVTDCAEYTGYIARIRGTVFPQGLHGLINGSTGIPFDSLAGGIDSTLFDVYYGCATPATITEAFIKALISIPLRSATFAETYSFPAGDGAKKDYIAFPTSFGTPSVFRDTLTGLGVPNVLAATGVSVTDSNGIVHSYDVWATVDTPLVSLSEALS